MSALTDIFVRLLIVMLFEAVECSTNDKSQSGKAADANSDIRFSIPDLSIIHSVNGIELDLQAYKVDGRDRNNLWVSIGQPVFIKDTEDGFYKFTPDKILIRLRLLAADQIEALVEKARISHPNITDAFVHLIPLDSISCRTSFGLVELQGEARNLNQYEVTIEIPCPEASTERAAFHARMNRSDPIKWKCTFTADGKQKFLNRIRITGKDLQKKADKHNLFGNASQVYVTRDQLTRFAQQIRTELNIEEDYELNEKFDEKLVERLLMFAAHSFEYVDIDDAIGNLSRYGFSNEDLAPDEIKHVLTDGMHDEERGSWQSEAAAQGRTRGESNSQARSFGFSLQLADVEASFGYDRKTSKSADMSRVAEKEQEDDSDIENQSMKKMEKIGAELIPKSLKVVLLDRAVFANDISIGYRKFVRRNAQYKKEISITTDYFMEDAIFTHMKKDVEKARESLTELMAQTEEMRANNSRIMQLIREQVKEHQPVFEEKWSEQMKLVEPLLISAKKVGNLLRDEWAQSDFISTIQELSATLAKEEEKKDYYVRKRNCQSPNQWTAYCDVGIKLDLQTCCELVVELRVGQI